MLKSEDVGEWLEASRLIEEEELYNNAYASCLSQDRDWPKKLEKMENKFFEKLNINKNKKIIEKSKNILKSMSKL